MASGRKTYQFVLTAEECQLFRLLRQQQNVLSLEPLPSDDPRLSQAVDISVKVGDRFLGRYEIDATQMILEFAKAGAQSYQDLWTEQDPEESSNGGDEGIPGAPITDRDSVLGTQSMLEDNNNRIDDEPPMSWTVVREKIIPSYIQDITFTVGEEAMNPICKEQLRDQFPGVVISTYRSNAEKEKNQQLKKKEKPRGVKNMIIELDEAEMVQDPKLDSKLQDQFPWASIESKPGPNTSRKRTSPTTEHGTSDSRRLDPIKHLSNLADYATEAPSDEEFGFKCPMNERWDVLPYARKLEIAHARAIQGEYGIIVSSACTHCTEQGFECKTYRPQLGSLSHMEFGNSCQNCRLGRIACDLLAAAKDSQLQTSISPKSTGRTLDTQIMPTVRPQETTVTPKSSLLSRVTVDHSEMHAKGVAIAGQEDETVALQSSLRELTSADVHKSMHASPGLPVLIVSDKIRLPIQVPNVVNSMYGQWQKNQEVKAFAPRLLKLQHFYSNLVTLYILAYAKNEMSLAYAVLLRFQNTNYRYTSDLPDIDTAIQAFRYLPLNSPLCQWIAILYSFLWGTQSEGDFFSFTSRKSIVDHVALSKFLYAVAYIRDPYTKGHDTAVLTRWCDVHNHAGGSPDEKALCETMRMTIKYSFNEEHDKNEHIASNTPFSKGKRKVDGYSKQPFKKNKRSGNHGLGTFTGDTDLHIEPSEQETLNPSTRSSGQSSEREINRSESQPKGKSTILPDTLYATSVPPKYLDPPHEKEGASGVPPSRDQILVEITDDELHLKLRPAARRGSAIRPTQRCITISSGEDDSSDSTEHDADDADDADETHWNERSNLNVTRDSDNETQRCTLDQYNDNFTQQAAPRATRKFIRRETSTQNSKKTKTKCTRRGCNEDLTQDDFTNNYTYCEDHRKHRRELQKQRENKKRNAGQCKVGSCVAKLTRDDIKRNYSRCEHHRRVRQAEKRKARDRQT